MKDAAISGEKVNRSLIFNMPVKDDAELGEGLIEFFKLDKGGYAVRYDRTENSGKSYFLHGGVISDESYENILSFALKGKNDAEQAYVESENIGFSL